MPPGALGRRGPRRCRACSSIDDVPGCADTETFDARRCRPRTMPPERDRRPPPREPGHRGEDRFPGRVVLLFEAIPAGHATTRAAIAEPASVRTQRHRRRPRSRCRRASRQDPCRRVTMPPPRATAVRRSRPRCPGGSGRRGRAVVPDDVSPRLDGLVGVGGPDHVEVGDRPERATARSVGGSVRPRRLRRSRG